VSTRAVPELVGVDLTDLDRFAHGFPHDVFAVHRRAAPVWWHEPTAHTPDGEGFWSVATYAETLAVLRDPETFSSETGGDRPYGGTMIQDLPVAGIVLNMMDDPRHARIRRLVSVGLTPRRVACLEEELRRRTRALIDALDPAAPFDLVGAVAAEIPMQVICILLGVPEGDRHWLFEAIEPIFDHVEGRESFWDEDAVSEAQTRMLEFGIELIAAKRAEPTDDLLSHAIHASLPDVEPPELTDGELYAFFALLFSAGSETTRNAMAGGLLALMERPDQLAALRSDGELLPTAVDEALRWTTPSPSKRRTATRATELAGHRIAPGEKVVVWEGSANRDDLVFPEAMTFDVARDPNPHLAFGHGVHFCLGASLARLELRVFFEELLARFASFELVEPVEWTRSNRHTGIRRMVVRGALV
jgi:cytochrome P450